MKNSRTAALGFLFVLLAPATSAQLAQWGEHAAFRQEMDQLSRNGMLRNPLIFVHLSCAAEVAEGSPPADCQPIIRLLSRRAEIDGYRLPGLPPNLVVPEARLRVDKPRLKREKGDLTFFTEACKKQEMQDICVGRWRLAKVWTVGQFSADTVRINLRTKLVKPGVTSHQIGSETPDQTLSLEVPVKALAESVLMPLWEQNGVLNVPMTYASRG